MWRCWIAGVHGLVDHTLQLQPRPLPPPLHNFKTWDGLVKRIIHLCSAKGNYEFLPVSEGQHKVQGIPLRFRSRQTGRSKLD